MQTIKTFKLFIIALIVCTNVFSQSSVYKPFPQGYGFWSVTRQSVSGSNYYKYQTSGDTLIGGYMYKKVLYAYNITPGPFNYSPYTFNFAYRNDSIAKKVYYLDVTGGINKDTLWYDFNLNVGDTIKNCYSNNSYNNIPFFEKVVQSIDSVLICGIYHKRFVYCISYSEGNLIEGVGFSSNFINGFTSECPPFEPGELDYTSFSTCTVNSAAEYLKEQQIKLFPIPTSSELEINTSLILREYVIINNVGEVVLKERVTNIQSIKVGSLADGIYMIQLKDNSGNNYQSKFIKQ